MELGCRLVVIFGLALFLLFVSGILFIRHHIYHFHGTLALKSNFHISEACLQCICEAGTECQSSKFKSGEMCSSFRISQTYWAEAGMPKLEGSLDGVDNFDAAYIRCVNNPLCAARTVNGYVGKHKRDCTGDGMINCLDYAKTHILGHMDCSANNLPPLTGVRLQQCLEEFSVI